MATSRRKLILPCLTGGLLLVAAFAVPATEADGTVTFRADFDRGPEPVVGAPHVTVENRGGTLVPGKDGRALRVGLKDGERRVLSYALTAAARAEEKAGHGCGLFPLTDGRVEFDFRACDWEIGRREALGLLRLVGDDAGYASVSYRHLQGKPQLQVLYGVSDRNRAGKRKAPLRWSFIPIVEKEKGGWHRVSVAWTRQDVTLRLDGNEKADLLTNSARPKRDGFRLELGAFADQKVSKEGDALVDIDNLAFTRTAAETDSAGAARTPLLRIPQTSAPITVDGRVDQAEWGAAALIRGFMNIRESNYSHHQPRVHIAYDGEFLYMGVRSPIHGGQSLVAKVADRDADVWRDDCIEIFLDPTPGTDDFHQFVINSKGVVVDLGYHLRKGERSTRTWDLDGLRVAAAAGKDAWDLEVAFPYAGFGRTRPEPGEEWLFNVCESRVGVGCFSICAVTHGYAERARHGRLIFGGDCPAVRVENFGALGAGVLELAMAYNHADEKDVAVVVRGSRYDETANTHFPVFSRNARLGKKAGVVVRTDGKKLGSHGTLDVSARIGPEQLYHTRIGYKILTKIEIETMRRVLTEAGPRLRVATLQPYAGPGQSQKVRVRILSRDKTVLDGGATGITGDRMNVLVDLSGLAPGDYHAVAELVDATGAVLTSDGPRLFTVFPDPPPWRSNPLGVSDKVPPPWTPLDIDAEADGRVVVKCWNREYRFGPDSLLPAGILSGGRQCLLAPMKVDLTLNGKPCELRNVEHSVTAGSARECRLDSVCRLDWGAVRAAATFEFDGFIWVDLVVEVNESVAKDGAQVDRLALVWRLPPEQSTLLNSGYRTLANTGATPAQWSKRADTAFWVGSEDGGISFAVESQQNWSTRAPDRQVRLARTDEGALVSVVMVDEPLAIPGNRVSYGFALLPTPIRPRPANCRKIRQCAWMSSKYLKPPYPVNMSFWTASAKYAGAPEWWTEDADLEAYYRGRNVRYRPEIFNYHGLKESGARSAWYATYSHTARNNPEFIWFGEAWRSGGRDRLYGNALYGYFRDLVVVCKTPGYGDWFLWRFDKSRRENSLVDGIYFDLMNWGPCSREDHGHGYVDREGKRRPTVQIREHRKWLLRIYTYLKEKDPATPVILHLSGHTAQVMGHAFCDFLWDGELWIREVIRDMSYENLSLDTFRAETLNSIYGPQVFWINQLGRARTFLTPAERKKRPLKPYAQRHLHAMLLVHDILPSGNDLFQKKTVKIWRMLDRFGLDDSDRMLPYWETDRGVALTPRDDNVVATAYVKSDRALIIAFNNTDADRDATVALDRAKVFGKAQADAALKWTDAEAEGADALATGAAVTLPIPKRDFRTLWVALE